MDTIIQTILWVLELNLASHFVIYLINIAKVNRDNPILFKLICYFITFALNLLAASWILFETNLSTNTRLYSYLIWILGLFIIHFLFDEDLLFRFNKFINFLMIVFLNLIGIGVWYILMFQ